MSDSQKSRTTQVVDFDSFRYTPQQNVLLYQPSVGSDGSNEHQQSNTATFVATPPQQITGGNNQIIQNSDGSYVYQSNRSYLVSPQKNVIVNSGESQQVKTSASVNVNYGTSQPSLNQTQSYVALLSEPLSSEMQQQQQQLNFQQPNEQFIQINSNVPQSSPMQNFIPQNGNSSQIKATLVNISQQQSPPTQYQVVNDNDTLNNIQFIQQQDGTSSSSSLLQSGTPRLSSTIYNNNNNTNSIGGAPIVALSQNMGFLQMQSPTQQQFTYTVPQQQIVLSNNIQRASTNVAGIQLISSNSNNDASANVSSPAQQMIINTTSTTTSTGAKRPGRGRGRARGETGGRGRRSTKVQERADNHMTTNQKEPTFKGIVIDPLDNNIATTMISSNSGKSRKNFPAVGATIAASSAGSTIQWLSKSSNPLPDTRINGNAANQIDMDPESINSIKYSHVNAAAAARHDLSDSSPSPDANLNLGNNNNYNNNVIDQFDDENFSTPKKKKFRRIKSYESSTDEYYSPDEKENEQGTEHHTDISKLPTPSMDDPDFNGREMTLLSSSFPAQKREEIWRIYTLIADRNMKKAADYLMSVNASAVTSPDFSSSDEPPATAQDVASPSLRVGPSSQTRAAVKDSNLKSSVTTFQTSSLKSTEGNKILPKYGSQKVMDSLHMNRTFHTTSPSKKTSTGKSAGAKDHVYHPKATRSGTLFTSEDTENIKRIQASSVSGIVIENDADVDDYDLIREEDFSSDDEYDGTYGGEYDAFARLPDNKKNQILRFFSVAPFEELLVMPGCSVKKANLLVALRPFTSWHDLTDKLTINRNVGIELIESCRRLIKIRCIVLKLLGECERIANDLQHKVAALKTHSDNLSNSVSSCGKMNEESISGTSSSTHDDEIWSVRTQPSNINTDLKLKPYQMVGLNWLVLMHKQDVNGILADEMGLGKTIQAIAFLAYLLETENSPGPHVIVVPSSTLDNWYRELELWCPSFQVQMYWGSQADRRRIRLALYRGQLRFHILLTSYNMLSSSYEDRQMFHKVCWHYALFDEAHMLKNMASQRYSHLMGINARRRLLLTGTPLQNNLVELISLLTFVMPHLFTARCDELCQMFTMLTTNSIKTSVIPSSNGNGERVAERGKNKKPLSAFEIERISQAKRIMGPFVLRRLKSDVLQQLPKKHEEIRYCDLSPSQFSLYNDLCVTFANELKENERLHMLRTQGASILMQLRKVSNHPLLHRKHYSNSVLRILARTLKTEDPGHIERAVEQFIYEDMEILSDYDIHRTCLMYPCIKKYALDPNKITESGKFAVLDDLLPTMQARDDRVLLFSQFTMMLDIIEMYMKNRGYSYIRMDGQTPVTDRQALIDRFNADESIFIFLLSTRAGGLGINLTAANVVILHDIDFNPYNDKQAEDRCHRVGQKRDVTVIRLISRGTVEEAVLRCAQKKLDLERQLHGLSEVSNTIMAEASDVVATPNGINEDSSSMMICSNLNSHQQQTQRSGGLLDSPFSPQKKSVNNDNKRKRGSSSNDVKKGGSMKTASNDDSELIHASEKDVLLLLKEALGLPNINEQNNT